MYLWYVSHPEAVFLSLPVSSYLPGTRTRGTCLSAWAPNAVEAEKGMQAKAEEFKAPGERDLSE
jgi:hypothetical protein